MKILLLGAIAVKELENSPKMVLTRKPAAELFIKIIEDGVHIREVVNLSINHNIYLSI
jgi:hypothetical protein